MKMFKKFSAVFCAFAAAVALSACSDNGGSAPTNNNASFGSESASAGGSSASAGADTDGSAQQIDSSGNSDSAGDPDSSGGSASSTSADASKTLVAYFSCTGNTKKLAEYAAEITGGDLYEIVPAEPYTSADLNYNDKNSRSTKEMNDKSCRPAISGKVDNFSGYGVVFIAYPIWWGEAPRIISTFVESYDFSGKTVVPFCTSASSPMGSSAKNLHSLTSGANWLDGARHSSSMSKSDMEKWINGLDL